MPKTTARPTSVATSGASLEAPCGHGGAALELEMPDLAAQITHLVLVRAVPLGMRRRATGVASRLHGAARGKMAWVRVCRQ